MKKYFTHKDLIQGWALERCLDCNTYILITPGDQEYKEVKKKLATIPGYNGFCIEHENEFYFTSDLTHNDLAQKIANLFDLDYTRKKKKYGGIRKRKIVQFKDDVMITTWDSIAEAGETLGINPGNICNACNKGIKAGGFNWKYLENSELSENK